MGWKIADFIYYPPASFAARSLRQVKLVKTFAASSSTAMLTTSRRKPGRRGVTLLEAVMSLTIFAMLSIVLTGTLQAAVALLRNQEQTSSTDIATTTMLWIEDQVRQSDQVQIASSSRLVLSNHPANPLLDRTLWRSGLQLILEQGGVRQVVAEPVQQLMFSDPSGQGRAVQIQLTAGEASGLQPVTSRTRIVALDWLK